jgi:hypothetical protein
MMFDIRSFHNHSKKKYDFAEMPNVVQISDALMCFVLPSEIRMISFASVNTEILKKKIQVQGDSFK